jgi:hypothetical protein
MQGELFSIRFTPAVHNSVAVQDFVHTQLL